MRERKRRSIIKALSWRISGSLATFFVVFAFTGQFILSLGVSGIEFIAKIVLYYLHERAWNHIHWGKN